MSCCVELQLPTDDDYSVVESDDGKVDRAETRSVAREKKKKRLNVSYTHATPLFKAIEKQQWESVLMFLTTSKWSNGFFVSSTDHLKNPTPSIQCQTWVTSYNRAKEIEWSQLPIHAAISYTAPAVVIQKLVDIYPDSLKEFDHEGMLPVHLAFGFALPDAVLSLLLKRYPESAQARGPGGRLPHQCCELGQNKIRGEVFGLIAEQTSDLARNDQEAYFRGYIRETHKKLAVDDEALSEEKDLKGLINDLIEDRKQLHELKKRIKKATETAQNKVSSENTKLKRIKSPKGITPKNIEPLTVDTNAANDDLHNMVISGTTPLSPIQSMKNYTKTPSNNKSEERKSRTSTPNKSSKSTKYSSKLTKTTRDEQ
jgi:hypothetical protein